MDEDTRQGLKEFAYEIAGFGNDYRDDMSDAILAALAEIDALTPDAELGAAVRKVWRVKNWAAPTDGGPALAFAYKTMDDGLLMVPVGWGVTTVYLTEGADANVWHDTPEAALKAAGLWEEEGGDGQ